MLTGLIGAFALSGQVTTLSLGEDVARGLGQRTGWPHMARSLVGPGHNGVIPIAGMLGGLIVVTADLLGRMLLAPVEIPAGVVTAAVGAPYFFYLLYRSRNQ